ncbi:PepSY domain-containing protein [Paludisphaera mucosa]|uniref:PepSY domain-containing protein n=1 Tax=Paludisphaera mucosa TaxID=3030827 RepID=A0ABT6FLC7_9BACT|nr:PepSY domain-containing protein [Paludisphaera mucosa]MDG3008324.1 PepSY domain-containing protein [Paludisphaera mucosa]
MKRRLSPMAVRRAHRWLGLFFSVTVFMSAASGVLHTAMSRTQSAPPPVRPTGGGLDASKATVTLAEAVAKLPDPSAVVEAVNVRQVGGEPWYQIFARGVPGAFYVNAASGRLDAGRDQAYAAQIASEFLGGGSPVKTGYLTKFDSEYVNIFRVLPVYKFDLADGKGTRVYVSTTTGSVTRHTDDSRQFEASIFSNFHKWMFIPNKDARDFLMVAVTSGVIVVSALGVVLFFMTRPRRRPVQTVQQGAATHA